MKDILPNTSGTEELPMKIMTRRPALTDAGYFMSARRALVWGESHRTVPAMKKIRNIDPQLPMICPAR
jgi:hypothetical protein